MKQRRELSTDTNSDYYYVGVGFGTRLATT
jgi:hypothetical protein